VASIEAEGEVKGNKGDSLVPDRVVKRMETVDERVTDMTKAA